MLARLLPGCGTTGTLALNIVQRICEQKTARLPAAKHLLEVTRRAPKSFGTRRRLFLRVHGWKNPLDGSAVSPQPTLYPVSRADSHRRQWQNRLQVHHGDSGFLNTAYKRREWYPMSMFGGVPHRERYHHVNLTKLVVTPRPEFKLASLKKGTLKP